MSFLYFLDLLGTAAFAASGSIAAIRHRMDLLGVLVLGMVTATGGGTLRDLLLGYSPPFCLEDETYLYLSLAASFAVFFCHKHIQKMRSPLLIFDAIGLGTFVVIGTGKALAFSLGPLGAIMMGVMTATAGGAIRDVLSGEVPLILKKEVYATACLAGAFLYVFLSKAGVPENTVALLAATCVILLRLLAIRFNWALPRRSGS